MNFCRVLIHAIALDSRVERDYWCMPKFNAGFVCFYRLNIHSDS